MNSRDFCFWLQGMFELSKAGDLPVTLSPNQVDIIEKHLALVFYHEIDPSYTKDEKKQEEMNKIHSGNNAVFKPPYSKDKDGNVYRC